MVRANVSSWLNAKRGKKVAATRGSVRIVGFEPCFGVADVARSGSLREARFHDLLPRRDVRVRSP